jgi:hypothetical protein
MVLARLCHHAHKQHGIKLCVWPGASKAPHPVLWLTPTPIATWAVRSLLLWGCGIAWVMWGIWRIVAAILEAKRGCIGVRVLTRLWREILPVLAKFKLTPRFRELFPPGFCMFFLPAKWWPAACGGRTRGRGCVFTWKVEALCGRSVRTPCNKWFENAGHAKQSIMLDSGLGNYLRAVTL